MPATLVQINVSAGGVPKHPVREALIANGGVAGDAQADRRYHGGPRQAVCWFSLERLEDLRADGYPVGPGSLGENLTTHGLDYRRVRIGDVFQIGDTVRVQITKPRVPCTTIQVYGMGIIKRLWGPDVPWGESGFYGRVVADGTARPGDPIRLASPGAEAPPPTTRKMSLSDP